MNSTTSSPGMTGGSGGTDKGKKRQNVVPVMANQILTAPEEGFSVEGIEVGMVVIVGRVTGLEKAATKTVYQIEDDTGVVEVVQWVDEESKQEEHVEGSNVKVVGSIRTQGEKKHVMAFKISGVNSQAEVDGHLLYVEFCRLKMRQLQNTINGQIGGDMGGGLQNSMMGGGLGVTPMGGSMNTQSFGNKNYDLVYNMIKACMEDQGLNKDNILNQCRGKLSKGEMESALEFLSNEGHIYSTIDEDHFKSTDGD